MATSSSVGGTGAGVLFLATLLMLLFRHKYPRWWFDWNVNVLGSLHSFVVGVFRWSLRVQAYAFALVTDSYPPFRLAE